MGSEQRKAYDLEEHDALIKKSLGEIEEMRIDILNFKDVTNKEAVAIEKRIQERI